MRPKFDLDKIKFSTDPGTFERAVGLYESGKVTQYGEHFGSYSAVVLGTHPYSVMVEARRHDSGSCDCYLGQRDRLCKHMVALAIHAVKEGKPLTDDDRQVVTGPSCSGELETLSKGELSEVRKSITSAMRYVKPYRGPSRIWFAYQNSLSEGCRRLAKIVSDLPVSEQTAKILTDMLLRLDRRLRIGGVDDSDGTVGTFMEQTVGVLMDYAKLDPSCLKAFQVLEGKETCWEWNEALLDLIQG